MKLNQRFLHMVVAMLLAAAVVAIGSYAEDAGPERILREQSPSLPMRTSSRPTASSPEPARRTIPT